MTTCTRKSPKLLRPLYPFIVALLVAAFSLPLQGYAAQTGQKSFASPEEAVDALIKGVESGNIKDLAGIFGSGNREVFRSGDATADRADRKRFLEAYKAKNSLIREGDGKAVLQVGTEDWPFPIPIVKKGERWSFDTKKGKQELINRRIGRNELSTIQACLAYVDAQRDYAAKDRDGDGLFEYAQKFLSTPGKKDGLYWDAREGEEESPLGDIFAAATSEGYKKKAGKPAPFHGYFFRILKAQGENAPGGAHEYLVKGRMIGGFAMIAYPAHYGVSGVMTFMVNHDGVVYEKDLGRNTVKTARAVKLFDPDKTWRKVEPKSN